MKTCKGFTLIELILVIAILAILSVAAIPKFVDTSIEARQVSREGVVGAVLAGLSIYRANDMVTREGAPGFYPSTLDSASSGTCSKDNPCFTEVTIYGIDDSKWIKLDTTTYTYNDGVALVTYTYDSGNGNFTKE